VFPLAQRLEAERLHAYVPVLKRTATHPAGAAARRSQPNISRLYQPARLYSERFAEGKSSPACQLSVSSPSVWSCDNIL